MLELDTEKEITRLVMCAVRGLPHKYCRDCYNLVHLMHRLASPVEKFAGCKPNTSFNINSDQLTDFFAGLYIAKGISMEET